MIVAANAPGQQADQGQKNEPFHASLLWHKKTSKISALVLDPLTFLPAVFDPSLAFPSKTSGILSHHNALVTSRSQAQRNIDRKGCSGRGALELQVSDELRSGGWDFIAERPFVFTDLFGRCLSRQFPAPERLQAAIGEPLGGQPQVPTS